MADTVKCKGCGSQIWVGAKIIDGYCHDCYVRGRHLPEDTDDEWLSPVNKKPAPKPTAKKPPAFRPFPKISLHGFRRFIKFLLILAVLLLILKSSFWVKSITISMAGETAAMNIIRKEKNKTFFDKGERMDYETIVVNRRALNEFRNSGSDYRMSGEFIYAYRDGARGTAANNFSTSIRAHVEMSYNSKTDVYKFEIRNTGTDEKMASYRIEDGAYYIVNENGKTYVLTDFFGERTAADISEDDSIYKFLMKYHMEYALYTGYLDREAEGFSLWGGAYFYRFIKIENPGLQAFSNSRIELRTYDNKPVWYIYEYHDKDSGIGCNVTLNYYYDKIPNDAPKVADYL